MEPSSPTTGAPTRKWAPSRAPTATSPAPPSTRRPRASPSRAPASPSTHNLLAAFVAARLAGVSADDFQRTLDTYRPENGRLQRFVVNGREVTLNLAKNPTGFNQNISLLQADERPKAVLFSINDNFNDGRDISWIWDVDFERLAAEKGLVALAGGTRAADVRVRLKYAGIDAAVTPAVEGALARVASLPDDMPLYVLTNYSALWPAKATLERLGERHD